MGILFCSGNCLLDLHIGCKYEQLFKSHHNSYFDHFSWTKSTILRYVVSQRKKKLECKNLFCKAKVSNFGEN